MEISIQEGGMRLGPGAVMRLHDGRGAHLHCVSGRVWITQDGDLRDVVLEPGQSHEVDRDGDTLVLALLSSALHVASRRCVACPN